MKFSHSLLLVCSVTALTACSDSIWPTMRPDYTIRVTPTAEGSVAAAPECPKWSDEGANPFDNQPLPQYGCAHAQNLAKMVENPNDLVEGRTLGNGRGVTAVGAVHRYDADQTRGLIMPSSDTSQTAVTTSSSGSSSISGDLTGGGTSPQLGAGVVAPAP